MSQDGAVPLGEATLRVLEFSAVLDQIAGYSQTPMGGDAVRAARPLVDPAAVLARHARVGEVRRYAAGRGYAGLGTAVPVDAPLARVTARGVVLEAGELLDVARLARTAMQLRRHLPDDPEAWPELTAARNSLGDLQPLIRQIDGLLSADGEVRDDASPALQRIRRQSRRLRTEVRARLERMTHDDRLQEALGDRVVTERAGRFVLPVRPGQRDRVEGIVHDTSSSGQTLFVEPMAVVEEQNRLARMAGEEREEVQRLLAEATAHVRAAEPSLRGAQLTVGLVDQLQAVARWAEQVGGVVPERAAGGLRLRQAYHPLIDRESFVPLDLELPDRISGLVITGPNTGGKTVALKTLGLHVLLGQCGIPVPAAEARLPVFARVHADIGDEQSIAASLSTFSAHMRNIVAFLADSPPGTLVLLDELGTGTDPEEGAALGVALLERLLDQGATVVVSTHHDALKAFGHADDRAVNAAMEFDPETLAPTYRVRVGRPGRSNALDIAHGLGLPATIVDRARGLLRADAVRLDEVIERLEHENREAEAERLELERRREDLDRVLDQQQVEEARRRERFVEVEQVAREAIRKAVKDLREEATRRLRELEAREPSGPRTERSKADERARWSATIGSLEGDAMRALRERLAAVEGGQPKAAAGPRDPTRRRSGPRRPAGRAGGRAPDVRSRDTVPADGPLTRGDLVTVAPFGLRGSVLRDWSDADGASVEVDVSGKRLLATRDQLSPDTGRSRRSRRSGIDTSFRSRRNTLPEIDLHGMTVEIALEAVDKYIDDAMLAGYPSVRLIHGYGTLRLRDAIQRWLANRPGVAGYSPAAPNEGGAGVTVVVLEG